MFPRSLFVVYGLVGLVLGGCSSDSESPDKSKARHVDGPNGAFAGGTVTSWADFDDKGTLSEVGFSLPISKLATLDSSQSLFLEMPAEVQAAGFVNHLGLQYNPAGHPPAPFEVPHFDLHFYGISNAVRATIGCVGEPMPGPDVVPEPYFISSVEMPPAGFCVPLMGIHAFDLTSPESTPTNPQPLTRTFLLGYHAGSVAFVEPVIASAWLETHADFTVQVARPTTLGWSSPTMWPGTASVIYQANDDTYHLTLSDFTPHQ